MYFYTILYGLILVNFEINWLKCGIFSIDANALNSNIQVTWELIYEIYGGYEQYISLIYIYIYIYCPLSNQINVALSCRIDIILCMQVLLKYASAFCLSLVSLPICEYERKIPLKLGPVHKGTCHTRKTWISCHQRTLQGHLGKIPLRWREKAI